MLSANEHLLHAGQPKRIPAATETAFRGDGSGSCDLRGCGVQQGVKQLAVGGINVGPHRCLQTPRVAPLCGQLLPAIKGK